MVLNRPAALRKGDTIAVTAPSFFVEKDAEYSAGLSALRQCGYNLVEARSTEARFEHSTLTARDRADELNSLFQRADINAIICSDGGATAIELLDLLDYGVIRENPKIFSGFSDITHLQLALLTKARIPSIHGFDVINGFGMARKRCMHQDVFWALAEGAIPDYEIPNSATLLREGTASGVLVGGWLEALINLTGTAYLGFDEDEPLILLIETVDLQPSKIAIMLNALRLSNWFANVSAVMIGEFTNCRETEYHDCVPALDTIIQRFAAAIERPVIANMPFGHGDHLQSYPVGIRAELDTKARRFSLLEPYSNLRNG